MNTKKVIKLYDEIFSEVKNLWEISEQGNKSNEILDVFLDELNMKQTPENRFVAYSRIGELRVEPLELYLKNIWEVIDENNKKSHIKIPNKLSDNRIVLDKAYNYVSRIYIDLQEKFIYELEKEKLVSEFELAIFKWTLNVWKAFNKFMPIWENAIIKQNEILDKKFEWNSEKIMNFLREKKLLEVSLHLASPEGEEQEYYIENDRSYSVLKAWRIFSYGEAFKSEVNSIIVALQGFIKNLKNFENEEKQNYIEYLIAIKEAFEERDCTKLLGKWQIVDEKWMSIKGPMQISHPLEFYEDKYRKAVAPEWDLRILDTETLDSKVEKNISNMYEKLYDEEISHPYFFHTSKNSTSLKKGRKFKEVYKESYNFSKDNFNRVGLFVSEPVMYFGSELNWMFSAQVVPNDEVISERFWKKIFAFPKMVLESKKKAPLMKLTKEVLDKNLIENYLKILEQDKLFFDIYDVETIGHEFGHTLWLTKDTETLMNKKTWNFKNIEEFKATAWGLCSYFMSPLSNSLLKEKEQEQKSNLIPICQERLSEDFNKNIIIMHLVRCIWLLKYREVAEVLPYYNESLIHLDIMFESEIFEIKNNKIILNWSLENYEILKKDYIDHYKKLINTYLEKIDAWEFLFNYVITDKFGDNISRNKKLREFGEYYYDLYKCIGNEVV